MADRIKKAARELQRLGRGAVPYQTCRRLLLTRGFEDAKTQIETWAREGAAELVRILKGAG